MTERLILAGLTIYKAIASPFLGPCCRFEPSCSDYSRIAIETHGSAKGLIMSARRIFRCHPFHVGGYDPVKK